MKHHVTEEANRDFQPQEKITDKSSQVSWEKRSTFSTSLGQRRFQAFLNYLFILILSFSKYFQDNGSTPNNCEVMKFCNLGDQSFKPDI